MRTIHWRRGSRWECVCRRPSSGSQGKDTKRPPFIWALLQEWDCWSTACTFKCIPKSNIKTRIHLRVIQPAFSCCHWGDFHPSLNSVIMFTLAAEVLLSAAFSFLLFCDLSPLELPQQQICYCQIHYMQHSLFIIYRLWYWCELWMWVTLMNLCCVFLQ